jgi:hypothetical protein
MTVSSGDIFLSATDVRNNARTFLIIHQEARAIEDAILFAADSGLLTAYVYNTYMTQTCLPQYKTITSSTVATGTVSAPTFTVGSQIIIDGVTVTLTGTTLAQTVIDINTAAVPNITASQASNYLVLTDITGADITTSGAAATVAGLAATTTGCVDVINNKIHLVNHGFQNGDEVILSSTGNFPIPLAGGVSYFVLLIDSNNFQLCSQYMDVVNRNPIILSAAGTGILEVRAYSPQEQYFDAWQGNGNADANRPLIDQMTGVMTYFTNFGYTITRQQNPNVAGGGVFWWIVRW